MITEKEISTLKITKMPRGKYIRTEEIKKKNSESLRGYKLTEEHRRKIGLGNKGKIQTEEAKRKIRLNHRKNQTKETSIKISKALIGRKEPREVTEKRIIKLKEWWDNKENREMQIEKILKGLLKRPTSYEQKISQICIENNLPFIYTGDGTFLIGHKNPDFVNEEKKIAIEVYNDYFKIRDYGSCENYEKERSEYFAKYGYKTIFLRKKDISNRDWRDICLNKIKEILL